MTDEAAPENLILHILREMRAEMNDRFDKVEDRFGTIDQRLGTIDQRLTGLESGLDELGIAVATLAVSNRHIRADVHKILANQDNHETRIKALETR